jgi:hypothetical protein
MASAAMATVADRARRIPSDAPASTRTCAGLHVAVPAAIAAHSAGAPLDSV